MSESRTHDDEARIVGALERRHAGPKAFRALSAPVWRAGRLSEKDKHLVAVAIAQITRCAFCIEHHAALARQCGATEAEALAVSYVSAALESIGEGTLSVTHGALSIEDEAAVRGMSVAQARLAFAQSVFATDAIDAPLVWITAAAVAYAQSNDARRQALHAQALAADAHPDALNEAYAIAVVLRAGAVYAHTLHVTDAFRDTRA
ncbi:CMD domain-containing protein [Paraburkholderia tropica]|uniref:carboxymuconolactone decarboxylase family protein n=1 Tax=Paraburkholderia tropica TaxID=92647 RepID=UPI001CB39DB9|nr:carboxymuconolactone decarboxylase family protein [Paraburkholderia tropica]CAG9222329.1 CMD domain-containing protein [Paraburkholderia tropica]